jgi:hypothetical protein
MADVIQAANGVLVWLLISPDSPSAVYVYIALAISGSVIGRAPGFTFDLIKARVYDYD